MGGEKTIKKYKRKGIKKMLFFETSGISNGFRKFYAERFDENTNRYAKTTDRQLFQRHDDRLIEIAEIFAE